MLYALNFFFLNMLFLILMQQFVSNKAQSLTSKESPQTCIKNIKTWVQEEFSVVCKKTVEDCLHMWKQFLLVLETPIVFTLSNTRKASRISSSLSVSFIFLAIMVRNSGKSMVPLPGMGDQ